MIVPSWSSEEWRRIEIEMETLCLRQERKGETKFTFKGIKIINFELRSSFKYSSCLFKWSKCWVQGQIQSNKAGSDVC